MAKKPNFSKLAQFNQDERMRAVQQRPSMLQGLTPTELAMLFPNYFKRGTPDIGGFHAAISKASAERQQTWQGSVDSRLDQQGGMLSRMRQEYAGGNYGSTSASGNLKQNQQEAYKAARAEGLSDSAARILVANMSGESLRDPASHHWDRSHMSQGIVQWDPNRAERIKNHFGAYPKDMSVAQQTKAAIWEMKTYYGASYGALTDENLSPSQRMHTVVADYERPQDVGGSVSTRMQYYNGLNIVEETGKGETPKQGKQGATPGQAGGQTTPGAPGADTTAQAGKRVEGTKFNVVSGYIVPQDKSLYDPRNASQCATLGKAFNPAVGRSSGWSIVDGDIKAGQVVATKQYNNPGADRVGAGYHTGVALTAPNEKGDFLLLEQYNGSGGAKTRWVNKNSYPVGHTGQTTSWGLISSGGKVHDEISQEALSYGEKLGGPNKGSVGTNAGTPGQGGESAPGVEGEVTSGPDNIGGTTIGEGEQQSASLMQPVAMMQNLMGMAGQMMGGTASPLGLITSAMGFIMPLIGSLAGERLSGEGMGDGRGHHRRHGHQSHRQSTIRQTTAKATTQSIPALPVDNSPISHRADIGQMSVKYESGGRGVATISSGRKDPGGVSYGEHQLASKTGTMGRYLRSPEGKTYAEKFAGLKPGSAEFNRVYKKLAEEDPKGFGKSQQDYITRTHYEPVYRHAKALGYNVNDPRVQEALYSISVQHGGAKKVVNMAKSSTGGSPEQQVESLFGARRQYVATKGMNFDTRYKSEKREILAMDVTKYKQDEMPTRMADARPVTTTGAVGVTPTTPTAGPMMPTQVASQQKQERGFFQKAQEFTGLGSTKSVAQPSADASGSPTTAVARPGPTTPTYVAPGTPSVSTSISNVVAPAKPISSQARNPEGIYSSFRQSDIAHQFAYGKKLSATPVTSTTNVPASPAIPPAPVTTPVTGAQMKAPGPAPDTTAMQMNQTTALTSVLSTSASQQKMPQFGQAPDSVMNHDNTMKAIQMPVDTPSAGRAFARAHGEETPGMFGEKHFSYGNQ